MIYQKPKPVKKKAIGTQKVSLSLPPAVVADLDLLSNAMGLSRSAFLSSLLSQTLPSMTSTVITLIGDADAVLDAYSDEPAVAQQRYSAHSKASIDDFIKNLTSGGQNDLFDSK